MKRISFICTGLLVVSSLALYAQGGPFSARATPAIDNVGMGPLPASLSPHRSEVFTENRGQWDSEARYHMGLDGMNVWITDRGVVYDLYRVDEQESSFPSSMTTSPTDNATGSTSAPKRTVSGHVVRFDFLATSSHSRALGVDDIGRRSNYFIGNDRRHWGADCRSYRSVRLQGLYDGIDAIFSLDGGLPRYDLIVAAGADPLAIRFRLGGVDTPCLQPDGGLMFTTSIGDHQMGRLYAYQREPDNTVKRVACSFQIDHDGSIGFSLGEYDPTKELIIDPLIYSTYLGGDMIDEGHAIAIESNGEIWIAGETMAGYFHHFPITSGAYAEFRGRGWSDIFVSKLDPRLDGAAQLTYSTVLAGSRDERATSLTLDGNGGIWAAGESSSRSFPMTADAVDTLFENDKGEAVLFHLDPSLSGVDQLAYSTFIGGEGSDGAMDLAIDTEGVLWMVGFASANLRTTPNALDTLYGDGKGFIVGIDPKNGGDDRLRYATYLGARGSNYITDVEVDDAGTVWVGGVVKSGAPAFPTTEDAFTRSFNGGLTDAFVARIDPGVQPEDQLLYATLIGGNDADKLVDLALDDNGSLWAIGDSYTSTIDIPTTESAPANRERRGKSDLFVMRFDVVEGSINVDYSALLGGSEDDWAAAIEVGPTGDVWILGTTTDGIHDFPTTAGAYDEDHNAVLATRYSSDNTDLFLARLNPADSNSGLDYATFLGGSHREVAKGLAIDNSGFIWVTGHAEYDKSMPFPVTEKAFDPMHSMEFSPQIKENDWDAILSCLDPRVVSDVSPSRNESRRLDLSERSTSPPLFALTTIFRGFRESRP